MNRILPFMSCACCSQRRKVERQVERVKIEAERIESLCPDVFEFWVPSAERLLKPPKPDDEDADEPGVSIVLALDFEHCPIDADLREFAIRELRRVAGDLVAAAEVLEGADAAGLEGAA
jgi:hypothetical protein